MAKVKGPLLSLSASGTFMGVMEFRTGGGETTVAGPRRKTPARSPAQAAQAARFRTATQAWGELSDAEKADWSASGEARGTNGYRLYLSEYMHQAIQPPAQPELPP